MNKLAEASLLGSLQKVVDQAVGELQEGRVIQRILAHDHTIWKPDPTEITNRLGWLDIAERMKAEVGRLQTFTHNVCEAGYTHALLLGMGGSSLAPELFRKTFGIQAGFLDVAILDSTDPGMVLRFANTLDMRKTLFIVATKSGGTVETLSGFKYFYNRVSAEVGEAQAGEHFVAITDPGSSLIDLGVKYHFRQTFLNDPNIGGRYSALSLFGLVPASLGGVDLTALLDNATAMAAVCQTDDDNPAAWLGAAIGETAKAGRDKLTFIASDAIASFGDWAEQLIAESTGKEGKGILPVVGEAVGVPDVYGPDRLFVHLRLSGDATHDAAVQSLHTAGHPVIRVDIDGIYDIGGQFFLWELATAIAGARLGINPFDQPNVEAAKIMAREMVAAYLKSGSLPAQKPDLTDGGIGVYARTGLAAKDAPSALREVIGQAQPGAYLALQAYVESTPDTEKLLQQLRVKLRDSTRLATTLGYGPRFLHSTGQLHKGDAGKGLFIQLTAADVEDTPIPDEAGQGASRMSFGVLKQAQALGDGQALRDGGRRVIRLHFIELMDGLTRLIDAL